MSDANDEKEIIELAAQQSATDTSNQDDKVSTDPSGEMYIRTED